MKRTYLPRRNQLLSAASARLGLCILVCALVILSVRLIFPQTLLGILRPLLVFSDSASSILGDFANGFANAQTLSRERDALATDNDVLARQNDVLTAKVADLERLLGDTSVSASVSHPTNSAGVVAGVLARPPESPYDTLIVAAGTDRGIAAGDRVTVEGGTPIGTVSTVGAHAARVTLLSAPGGSINAWLGDARTPLSLVGEGGGTFSAEIPRTATTSVGEIVFAAGPGALPIGTVRGESNDPSSPTVELRIASLVNVFSIPYVLITPSRGL